MSVSENIQPRPHARLRGLLAHDHERLDKLFEDVLAAFGADAREDAARLWGQLDRGLAEHMEFEERQMLPAFRAVDRREADALLREHDLIRHRLIELGMGLDLHCLRVELVADFIALLRGHARREDALLYRWAERELPPSAQAPFAPAPPSGTAQRALWARASGG